MLKKEWITNVNMLDDGGNHTEQWRAARLSKFTASEWHKMMGDKEFTQGALSYIYTRVGENLTGLPCRDEASNDSTRHGNLYEKNGLQEAKRILNIEYLVTQKVIAEPDSLFGCTPDGIFVKSILQDDSAYEVETVEVKSPYTYEAYIALALCETPEDVKRIDKSYYWQVLFQMNICGALRGHLVIHQPFFKQGKTRMIEFRRINLRDDFKLIEVRKKLAIDKFNEVREKLFTLKY